MYQSILIVHFISKTKLIQAKMIINYCQRKYLYLLLILPDRHFTKDVFLISLKMGNRSAQPGK